MLKGFSAQTGSYSSFFTEAQQLKEMPRIIWTKILPLPEDIYISDISQNHALNTRLLHRKVGERCPSAKAITL